MKRFLTLFFVLTLVLCLASCGKSDKKEVKANDISESAEKGRIPECEFVLGEDADKITSALKGKAEAKDAGEDDFYETLKGEKFTKIITSKAHYIHKNGEGVICKIVMFDTAFGYDIGTDMDTVKNSQEKFGLKGYETSLNPQDVKDFSGNDLCTYLEYEFENYTVVFAFEENSLIGTSIAANNI